MSTVYDLANLPSYLTHCLSYNGSAWVDDYTWKISFNKAPTKRFRLRISREYLDSGSAVSLHHDLIFVSNADYIRNPQTAAEADSMKFWASSSTIMDTACQPINLRPIKFQEGLDTGALVLTDLDASVTAQLDLTAHALKKIKINDAWSGYASIHSLDYVWIEVIFVGDFIRPDSFRQDLNEASKVQHNETTTANSTVTGTSTLNDVTANTLDLTTSISGGIIESIARTTATEQLFSLPIIAKNIAIGDGVLSINQPVLYDTNEKVLKQVSYKTSNNVDITSSFGISTWNTWKNQKMRVLISSKKVNYTLANSEADTITYSETSSSSYNVKGASAIQFNPYDSTWQAGLVSSKTTFTDDAPNTGEATAQATYGGATLVGNLPFLVRANDRKSVLLADRGRIPFFGLSELDDSSTLELSKADQLQTNTSFKIEKIGSVYSLNVPSFSVRNKDLIDGSQYLKTSITYDSLSLGTIAENSGSTLDNHGSVISFHDKVVSSGITRFSGARVKLDGEVFSVSVRDPQDTYADVSKDTASLKSVLAYSFPRPATDPDDLTLGNTNSLLVMNLSFNSLNIGTTGSESSPTITYGKLATEHTFQGNVTMFTISDSIQPKLMILSAANSATDTSNSPLISSGSDQVRLSTTGVIRSLSIDRIWDYFRRIVGGGTVPTIVAENTYNTALANDFTLFSEVSGIVSNPAISTFQPSAPAGIFVQAATPKSLRQLEVDILKTRYNQTTVTNYIKARKVDKGLDGNDGLSGDYGSLWQLHRSELAYGNSFTHPGAGDTVSRDSVYLAASGEWKYLFDQVRVPIKIE